MIIEEKWVFNGSAPSENVPCWKCGGSADRIIARTNTTADKNRESKVRRPTPIQEKN
jgi:hypothetical protein